MGHNYAKPATAEQRLGRVLSRIPPDWAVSVEREPVSGKWRATAHAPGEAGQWAGDASGLVEALEAAWRLNRAPAG